MFSLPYSITHKLTLNGDNLYFYNTFYISDIFFKRSCQCNLNDANLKNMYLAYDKYIIMPHVHLSVHYNLCIIMYNGLTYIII